MRYLSHLFTALLLLVASSAHANILVLVHGYLGSSQSWVESGIVEILQKRGRVLEGSYHYSAAGTYYASTGIKANQPVYTVDLPSMAPVIMQADWLSAYLREIEKKHPKTPITVAGHSAGGIVARAALVKNSPGMVKHLITIAAPHLGTSRAHQALDATNSSGIFGGIKSWAVKNKTGPQLYRTIKHSRGILVDLTPPRPGNFLHWLNQQAHPPIAYTSIIRTGTFQMPGDQIVPGFSQDLRNIPVLGERAQSYVMASGHMLTPQDGHLLANLLTMENSPAKAHDHYNNSDHIPAQTR